MAEPFKAYDIRGIFPDQVNAELAYKIGRAFVTFLNPERVVVGMDCRVHSPELFDALVKGITDQGADVLDIGHSSTPMLYFSVANYNHPGGIIVTASHNPKQYNGFKMVGNKGIALSADTGIKEIEELVKKNEFEDPEEKGKISQFDVFEDYVAHVLSFSGDVKPLKVAVDYSSGMASVAGPKIFEMLGMNVFPINDKLDGTFSAHDPNPLKDGVKDQLREEVKKHHADIGIIFDSDADRVMFVDEEGNDVDTVVFAALIGEKILHEKPGSLILPDLRMSKAIMEYIRNCGGRIEKVRVGHSYVKSKMREDDGEFAAELSGHYYFKDNFVQDSGIIAAVYVLNMLSGKGKKLSEITADIMKYAYSGEINFEVEDRTKIIEALKKRYSDGTLSELDGITIEYDDWWFNVRPSNTEPLIRLVAEADNEHILKEKVAELKKDIKSMS